MTQSGVTKEFLTSQLQQLGNALRTELYGSINGLSSVPPAQGGIGGAIAITQNISKLSGVTLTNATVNGLSGLTADDIPALDYFAATSTISVAYGGTGTSSAPVYGQLLVGDGSGGYNLLATSSLGIVAGSGDGSDFPFTPTQNYGALANSTSTALWFQNGLQASSTSHFVYASSSSVYGNGPVLPKSEQQIPSPISPYAVSKLTGEYYCKVFTELYGVETVSLRYFNVYGPRQDPNSQYAAVIPRFIRWAFRGEPMEVHGDGLQSRDFTYIDNVVAANLRAAHSREGIGGVFNVGQGKAHTLLDLVDLLQETLGIELRLLHTAGRPGDVRDTLADIFQAERCLAYRPQVSFEEGIARSVEYLGRQIEQGALPEPAMQLQNRV